MWRKMWTDPCGASTGLNSTGLNAFEPDCVCPSGHWAQSYFFRLAIKVALQMKMHRANNVSGDVTPCFSQPDWRPAALRASCVFFNLISRLLLKPKLLSVLVIASMNRLRRVSMSWWMPPLITIKVSAAGGKWLRCTGRHGAVAAASGTGRTWRNSL